MTELKDLEMEAFKRNISPPSKSTLSKYGLNKQSWLWIMAKQDWKCPICHREDGTWNIDHFHVPGWKWMEPESRATYVRGILCAMCNYRKAPSRMTSTDAGRLRKYLSDYEMRARIGANLGKLCECHGVPMQKSGERWRCAITRGEWNKRRRASKIDSIRQHIQLEIDRRGGCEYPGCEWEGKLEWHHRDPDLKSFNIGESGGAIRSYSAITAEMEKCDLLCPNHHSLADAALGARLHNSPKY